MGLRIHGWCGNFQNRQESGTTSRTSISSFVRHALSGWHASFKPSKVAQRLKVSHPLGDLGSFWWFFFGWKKNPQNFPTWEMETSATKNKPKLFAERCISWQEQCVKDVEKLEKAWCFLRGSIEAAYSHPFLHSMLFQKVVVKYSIFLMLKVNQVNTSKLKVLIFASEKWLRSR